MELHVSNILTALEINSGLPVPRGRVLGYFHFWQARRKNDNHAFISSPIFHPTATSLLSCMER